jgi:Arylsulfotransferase (ASST)
MRRGGRSPSAPAWRTALALLAGAGAAAVLYACGSTKGTSGLPNGEVEPIVWQGKILGVGFGQGEDLIYNSSYQKIGEVKAGNSYHADLHEIRLTPQGTAWIDIFDPIHVNLASVKGPSDGVLSDSVIEEIDIKTGLVMWEWHALGHIAITDSFNPLPSNGRPWDYVHINSVNPGSSGRYAAVRAQHVDFV